MAINFRMSSTRAACIAAMLSAALFAPKAYCAKSSDKTAPVANPDAGIVWLKPGTMPQQTPQPMQQQARPQQGLQQAAPPYPQQYADPQYQPQQYQPQYPQQYPQQYPPQYAPQYPAPQYQAPYQQQYPAPQYAQPYPAASQQYQAPYPQYTGPQPQVPQQQMPPQQQALQQQAPQQQAAQRQATPAQARQQESPAAAMQRPQEPAVEPAEFTWQIAAADRTLRSVLARWSEASGWQLVWELPVDYPLEARAQIAGRFEDAVATVVNSLERSETPMKAIFYRGNKVLRVVAKGAL